MCLLGKVTQEGSLDCQTAHAPEIAIAESSQREPLFEGIPYHQLPPMWNQSGVSWNIKFPAERLVCYKMIDVCSRLEAVYQLLSSNKIRR